MKNTQTRRFDGKVYHYFDQTTNRREADTWASKIRNRGDWYARITSHFADRRYQFYVVWERRGG